MTRGPEGLQNILFSKGHKAISVLVFTRGGKRRKMHIG